MPTFHTTDSFTIPSRNTFVFTGDVAKGLIRPGMTVHIPLNDATTLSTPITHIGTLQTSSPYKLGLSIHADATTATRLKAQNIHDIDLEVT